MKVPQQPSAPRLLPPSGPQIGRVIEIIYLGTQKGEWKGQPKDQFKVRIKWELPFKKHTFKEGEGEKPFVVSSKFTLSMYKNSLLRPIVEGIIGETLKDEEADSFDLDYILDKPSIVSVEHKDGTEGKYAVVSKTMSLMEGQTCPPALNKPRILSFEHWDENMFESLPEFIKDQIKVSPEYMKMRNPVPKVAELIDYPTEELNPDDIPF